MPVTVYEIARASGISQPAVSQILNNKGVFKEETRQRVFRIADELGYRPNAYARAMREGQLGVIALMLGNEPGGPFIPPPLLGGIQEALSERELHLTVGELPEEKRLDEGLVPRMLREWTSDGVLFSYSGPTPSALKGIIARYHIPAVRIGAQDDADCVYFSDQEAGQLAARHLSELGHRRIHALRFGGSRSPVAFPGDRRPGAEEPARTTANPVDTLVARLRGADRPTAFIAYGESEAAAIFQAAAVAGLRIPDDLSVIGVLWGGQLAASLNLTRVRLPERALGRAGVEMLLQKIENPGETIAPRVLTAELVLNRTTGPVPPRT